MNNLKKFIIILYITFFIIFTPNYTKITFEIEDNWTNFFDCGQGTIETLFKYQVYCPDNYIMKFFKADSLKLNSSWNMGYVYSCIKNDKKYIEKNGSNKVLYTDWVNGSKSDYASILYNYAFLCPEQHALNGFNLEYDEIGQKIRYKYICSPVPLIGQSCRIFESDFVEAEDGQIWHMDKVEDFKLEDGEFLASFSRSIEYYRNILFQKKEKFRSTYMLCKMHDLTKGREVNKNLDSNEDSLLRSSLNVKINEESNQNYINQNFNFLKDLKDNDNLDDLSFLKNLSKSVNKNDDSNYENSNIPVKFLE